VDRDSQSQRKRAQTVCWRVDKDGFQLIAAIAPIDEAAIESIHPHFLLLAIGVHGGDRFSLLKRRCLPSLEAAIQASDEQADQHLAAGWVHSDYAGECEL